MSLGPGEILVVLLVALIVFGPKRLPEIGRQVGSAMRELRKMQESVRSELDSVMHPDIPPEVTPSANGDGSATPSEPTTQMQTQPPAQIEEPGHQAPPRALLPGSEEPNDVNDGFPGPSSFS